MGNVNSNKFSDKINSIDTLYFAVVAHIMMHFATIYKNNKKAKDISQEVLVSKYVACVAKRITECEHQWLLRNRDEETDNNSLNLGNKSRISRILKGEGYFKISSDFVGEITEERISVFTSRFTLYLENEFEEKRLLMLSLLYIISNDESIRNSENSFELFKKYIYKENGIYVFAELMVGILLYLIFNVKNEIKEKEYANSICARLAMGRHGRNRYSPKNSHIFNLINNAESYFAKVKYSWNDDNKALNLGGNVLFKEIFEKWTPPKTDINGNVPLDIVESDLQNNSITEKDWEAALALIDEELNQVFSDPMFKKCYFCFFFAQIIGNQKKGFCNKHNATVDWTWDDCNNYQRNDEVIFEWIVNAYNLNDGWRI